MRYVFWIVFFIYMAWALELSMDLATKVRNFTIHKNAEQLRY